jgi:hypothetical protein
MLGAKPELVWQGRVHLGDEPGVYGDAAYSGLSVEFPLTLEKTGSGPDTATLVVKTEGVQTSSGYPGHLLTVRLYEEDSNKPNHWLSSVLVTEHLTGEDENEQALAFSLEGKTSPYFLSVAVAIDTEVPPGLYDDFVVTRVLNHTQNFVFVASLGFKA